MTVSLVHLRRLIATLLLAISVAWLPLAGEQSMEMAKAASNSAIDDTGAMDMGGMPMDGMAMDGTTEDLCEACSIDMTFNVSCATAGGLAIPALSSGLTLPDLASAVIFASSGDPELREQIDRPPFQPPKFSGLG